MAQHPSLTRKQILAFRRATNGLEARTKKGKRSLRRAAWAGLQDSMPRAAVLSLHARISGIEADAWSDPAYAQVWGPRYSVFVVPEQDAALFTLGRLPTDQKGHERAYRTAANMRRILDGDARPFSEVGKALGVNHNSLRYATTTGTVRLRWDGARQPTVWMVPSPEVDPAKARLELARRFLHIYGPAGTDAFSAWAGMKPRTAHETFARLERSLTAVATPIGEAWLLNSDLELAQTSPEPSTSVRLLPSGDAYYLLQGEQRDLLVPDRSFQDLLWTSRVWPGAVLANGEIVGTWRRSKTRVTVNAWKDVPKKTVDAVETEAASLPLPDQGDITVEWVRGEQ